MPIILHPHPILARVAAPVDFDKESYEERSSIVRNMGNALSNASYGGKLGLAAPQIGISKRICIVQGAVMFNPEWKPSAAPGDDITEACYSVPGRLFKVTRAPYGWARWQSIDGSWREQKLKDLSAVVFQHELDHLDGKCCADVGEEIPQK
jgi:peptide deformylase